MVEYRALLKIYWEVEFLKQYFKNLLKHGKMALLSLLVLVASVFTDSAAVVTAATVSGDQNSANVKITNISSSSSTVKDGDELSLTVSFSGNSGVKPGEQLTINLPEATDTTGGLYGIKTDVPISATQNGQTIQNVATAHVEGHKVTITFNQNITKLPNGFTGTFTFQAEAQKGNANEDGNGNVPINSQWPNGVQGPTVTITPSIDHDGDTGSGGTDVPGLPSIIKNLEITKIGSQGKDGNINWQFSAQVPDSPEYWGPVTLTDVPTPSEPVNWNSFYFYLTDPDGSVQHYTIQQLENEGVIFQEDTPVQGGFVMTAPNGFLQGKKWVIGYRMLLDNPIVGQQFHNDASINTPGGNADSAANVTIKYHGSGSIVGFENGKLILVKEDQQTHVVLPGAQFQLTDISDNSIKTTTSDQEGKIIFNGLEDGNYTLKEIKAPSGYQVSDKVYHFTVSQGKLINSNLPGDNVMMNSKIVSSSSSLSSEAVSSTSKKSSSSELSSSSKVISSSKKNSSSEVISSSKASSSELSSNSESIGSKHSSHHRTGHSSSSKVSASSSEVTVSPKNNSNLSNEEASSSSQANVVVANNNHNGSGHGQGKESSFKRYGKGLPQTGESENIAWLVAGMVVIASATGLAIIAKRKF